MTDERRFYVYVIELDDAVGKRINPKKPCVYVGQSVHPPEVRFKQHKDGYKASKYVHKHGMRLKPRLYGRINPLPTREEALSKERELAARLRRKEYTVFGGH
jgi:predicted GIY-YIG superfamily endonuclease